MHAQRGRWRCVWNPSHYNNFQNTQCGKHSASLGLNPQCNTRPHKINIHSGTCTLLSRVACAHALAYLHNFLRLGIYVCQSCEASLVVWDTFTALAAPTCAPGEQWPMAARMSACLKRPCHIHLHKYSCQERILWDLLHWGITRLHESGKSQSPMVQPIQHNTDPSSPAFPNKYSIFDMVPSLIFPAH